MFISSAVTNLKRKRKKELFSFTHVQRFLSYHLIYVCTILLPLQILTFHFTFWSRTVYCMYKHVVQFIYQSSIYKIGQTFLLGKNWTFCNYDLPWAKTWRRARYRTRCWSCSAPSARYRARDPYQRQRTDLDYRYKYMCVYECVGGEKYIYREREINTVPKTHTSDREQT